MLKSFFDFGENNKSFYSEHEENFKKFFRKEFNIDVIETSYAKGEQNNIGLWCDFSCIKERLEIELYYFVKNNERGRPLNVESYCYDFEPIIRKILDFFLNHMGVEMTANETTNIYIYEFKAFVTKYALGHSIVNIRNKLKSEFDLSYIFICDRALVKIVCKDLRQKQFCLERKKDIVDIFFKFMKQFDNYNVLQLDDINIKILSRDEMSDLEFSFYENVKDDII